MGTGDLPSWGLASQNENNQGGCWSKNEKTTLTWIQSQHEDGSAYSLLRALHFWHGMSHTNTGWLHDWQGCKHPTWTMSLPPLCDAYPSYEDSIKWQLRRNVPSSLRSIIHNGNWQISPDTREPYTYNVPPRILQDSATTASVPEKGWEEG